MDTFIVYKSTTIDYCYYIYYIKLHKIVDINAYVC